LSKPVWKKAQIVRVEYALSDGDARPKISTAVRCLWSHDYLYLAYQCPFTKLTVFDDIPPHPGKRMGLWDRDVVEAFIGSDGQHINRYGEFEVAPTNERLDLFVKLPDKDLGWTSGFESATRKDDGIWTAELRIPMSALSDKPPQAGDRWRMNLFRHDVAHRAFLAWNPTLNDTAHTPEKFGVLELLE